MFRIEPGDWKVRRERSPPLETTVGHQFHPEQRVREAGEIVVVYPRIDKSGGKFQLSHVVFHREFAVPKRQARPHGVVDGVIRHAAVDVMLDGSRSLGCVGQTTSNSNLIASLGSGVYKSKRCAFEEGVHELDIVQQRALEEGDIGKPEELLGDDAFEGVDLSSHLVSDG